MRQGATFFWLLLVNPAYPNNVFVSKIINNNQSKHHFMNSSTNPILLSQGLLSASLSFLMVGIGVPSSAVVVGVEEGR